MRQRIGLHIRLSKSILEPMQKAQRLKLPFFQCFFVLQATGRLIKVTEHEVSMFRSQRQHFNQLYLHGSYWINLASLGYNGYRALESELNLAKQLEFSAMILHPGTAKGAKKKEQGIDALARALNKLLKFEHEICVILENTAHGNLTIGSDILDFQQLLVKINHPEKIYFCIDTSHAYSFGYDIRKPHDQEIFIEFLDNTIGIDRIKLIHLNDAKERLGSRIDRHAIVGEGEIGKEALRRFILHPKILHIPIIMELPVLSETREVAILDEVYSWGV